MTTTTSSPNTGYKQSLFYGNETNYGSSAVINTALGLVQSISPTESNNLIKIRTLGGNRDYSNVVAGKFEVSGNFDVYLQTGKFLRFAIGEDTATSATIDSGPQIHTGASYMHCLGSANSPHANAFPSFTLEFTDYEDNGAYATTKNLKRKFTGCRVNNTSISATVDEPLKFTVDWIAQGVGISTAAAATVTQPTDDPYVFYQGMVYATTGTITKYTVADKTSQIAEVNGFDFAVSNNLEATWYISGTTNVYQTKRGLKSLIPKGRDYTGTLNLHFSNKKMYEKFLGAAGATGPQDTLTGYKIVLDFVRSGTIGATPKLVTDDWLRIVLPNTKFGTINITGAPEDIVNQTITMEIPSAKIYIVDDISTYK